MAKIRLVGSVLYCLLPHSEMYMKVVLYIKVNQGSHTPFWERGWGPLNGKISCIWTKIGKFDIVLMYDISIARLIPIIKLTLVYYEKRESKKQV